MTYEAHAVSTYTYDVDAVVIATALAGRIGKTRASPFAWCLVSSRPPDSCVRRCGRPWWRAACGGRAPDGLLTGSLRRASHDFFCCIDYYRCVVTAYERDHHHAARRVHLTRKKNMNYMTERRYRVRCRCSLGRLLGQKR